MSDPNMDQAAENRPNQDADEGVGTPESELNMGTTIVGGPVETGGEQDDEDEGLLERV